MNRAKGAGSKLNFLRAGDVVMERNLDIGAADTQLHVYKNRRGIIYK